MGFIHLSLPLGFTLVTVAVVILEMILSIVWWDKWMVHFPEDDIPWDEKDPFVMKFE